MSKESNPESHGVPGLRKPVAEAWQHERAPAWFTNAVAQPTRAHYAEASGARIHYLSWNERDRLKPALLFLHGLRAHARWWSFIAPFFTERFRVYALDFSGMGDSDARERYDPLQFVEDIAAVIAHAGIAPATLVGHSFGGGRTLRLCGDHPELVARALVIDAYVHFASVDVRRPQFAIGPRRVYGSVAEAKARYRLTPADPTALDYVLDYIAHHSLEPVDGGFRWKFADGLQGTRSELDGVELLGRIPVPVTYLYGELSHLSLGGRPERIVQHLKQGQGPIAIPQAGHHVPLAQPLALVAALRAALR